MRDNTNNPDRLTNLSDDQLDKRSGERADRNPIYRENGEIREGRMENLPDRQMAERNSPYRLANDSFDQEDLQDLSDRQMAERNSPYRLAGERGDRGERNSPYQLPKDEAHQIELNDEGTDAHTWSARDDEDGTDSIDGRASTARMQGNLSGGGSNNGGGGSRQRQGSGNGPLNRQDSDSDDSGIQPIDDSGVSQHGQNRQHYTARSGGSHMNDERYNQDDQSRYQNENGKENSIPGTVSQNTDPIDQTSKLDALTGGQTQSMGQSQRQGSMGQPARQSDGNSAVRGEHSQVGHGQSTTSQWQREAYAASTDGQLVGREETSQLGPQHHRGDPNLSIPAAEGGTRQANAPRVQESVDREFDTRNNMATRTDGYTAIQGEHSQVDRYSQGGTTEDWKNMPSSSYQGTAGITDKDRRRGEMSTDWDGTASSEHPNPENPLNENIRNNTSGGNVSQGQSLGQ